VIENCGVKFHSQNALDVLSRPTAPLSTRDTVAKIPADVAERR
jgi:hypothetical protein